MHDQQDGPPLVRAALVQFQASESVAENREKIIQALRHSAAKGAQVVCFQELATTPYFCQEVHSRWFETAEPIPGPTTEAVAELCRELQVVVILPLFERAQAGLYYNTAVVIDRDGTIAGKYRKVHIPDTFPSGGSEKFYFRPGNLGFPVFDTSIGKVGVYICYDRHFPEGARLLALHGARIIFIPATTPAAQSRFLWELEGQMLAASNGCYVAVINRVGVEPWGEGEFYGSSYFAGPEGEIMQKASTESQVLVHDLAMSQIETIRHKWPFLRDRRPEAYGDLSRDLF